jgi:hypothetical protein
MNLIIFFISALLFSEQIPVQRPEPDKVIKTIEPLNITEEQKEKIYKDLLKNLKKYDSEKKKYDKKIEEKNQIDRDIEKIKSNMIEINKNVTLIIKSYLDNEQLKKLEELVKKQKEKISQSKPKENSDSEIKEEKEKKDVDKAVETQSPFSIYFP